MSESAQSGSVFRRPLDNRALSLWAARLGLVPDRLAALVSGELPRDSSESAAALRVLLAVAKPGPARDDRLNELRPRLVPSKPAGIDLVVAMPALNTGLDEDELVDVIADRLWWNGIQKRVSPEAATKYAAAMVKPVPDSESTVNREFIRLFLIYETLSLKLLPADQLTQAQEKLSKVRDDLRAELCGESAEQFVAADNTLDRRLAISCVEVLACARLADTVEARQLHWPRGSDTHKIAGPRDLTESHAMGSIL